MPRLSDTFRRRDRGVPPDFWGAFSKWLSPALGEIVSDAQLLEDCYCTERQRGQGDSKWDYENETIVPFISDQIEGFFVGNRPDVPIVLMGDAGVGKTTFIHHALRQIARTNPNIVPIIFDFRDVSSSSKEELSRLFNDRLSSHLLKSFDQFNLRSAAAKQDLIEEIFKNKLNEHLLEYNIGEDRRMRSARLNEKVVALLDGYLEDEKLYNLMRVLYVHDAMKKQIVLVFDNFDHELHDDRFQENVFGLAKAVTREFAVPIILPMRNYTRYDAFDRYGYMEAYKYRSFTLAPVQLDGMLRKRFDYVRANLRKWTVLLADQSTRVRTPRSDMETALERVMVSYLEQPDVWEFLVSVSGENARTLLSLVSKSLQSQHVAFRDVSGSVSIGMERFLASVTLGNNPFYNPEDRETIILNLFDNDEQFGRTNTLVRIRLLQFLKYAGQAVAITDLFKEMERLGHATASSRKALNKFIKTGLVNVIPHHTREVTNEDITEVGLASVGRFYISSILSNSHYLECVLPSTNVPETEEHNLRPLIEQDSTRRGLEGRRDALMAFATWVKSIEYAEGEAANQSVRQQMGQIYPRVNSVLSAAINTRFSGLKTGL